VGRRRGQGRPRARSNQVRDILPAVLPVDVQDDRRPLDRHHPARAPGDVAQLAATAALVGMVPQPGVSALRHAFRPRREPLVVVAFVASLGGA